MGFADRGAHATLLRTWGLDCPAPRLIEETIPIATIRIVMWWPSSPNTI